MKSRKSSIHERLNTTKQKITTTKSQSAIPNTNKSTTDFTKKNFHGLHNYTNLFGQKAPFHIGDADTLFRKSLRKYNEFQLKNTSWIRLKEAPKPSHPCHQPIRVEHVKAAGDSFVSDKTFSSEKGYFLTEQDPTSLNLARFQSLHLSLASPETLSPLSNFEAKFESETQFFSNNSQTSIFTMDEAEGGEVVGDVAPGDVVLDEKIVTEDMIAEANKGEGAEDTIAEANKGGEGEVANTDEDFKKMLEKSIEEIKAAAEEIDPEALDEITLKVHDKIEELEGDKKSDGGDATTAIVPFGKDVLSELQKAELQAQSTANVINGLKDKVAALLSKENMTAAEAKDVEDMNLAMVKHMEDFEATMKLIQVLVSFADQHIKTPGVTAGSMAQRNLPPPQKKQPEDMLPKVIICGTTDDNMPKIIICDGDKKKKRPRSSKTSPSIGQGLGQTCKETCVVPKIAKRLSDSYDMQEKLAADNMHLEDKRFQLQEQLLNKDQTCDNLQRKVCTLQTEVRLLSKENNALNEKLAKVQGKCRPRPDMPCGSGAGVGSGGMGGGGGGMPPRGGGGSVCPADMESRLEQYTKTTGALERQVEAMECEVRKMQDELCNVQRERADLEAARKQAASCPPPLSPCPPPPPPQHVCRPTCHGPCRPGAAVEQQLRELREQYNRLQDDYKCKLTEVASLRSDNEKLKCTCKDLDKSRRMSDSKADDMHRDLKRMEEDQKRLVGSKEQLIEQEQQLVVAKQRFREAQDELEEVRALIGDQAAQLEDYRNKYLQAQQQVEEQRRQIDVMEMENNRVSDQVAVEIQRVKNQFQEKLAELSPLPEILKGTQLKLQEEQQLRMLAERNSEALSRELQLAKEKEQSIASQIEKVRSDQLMNEDEKASLMSKIDGWECKCNEMQQDCDKLKTDLARAEEAMNLNTKRLDEKLHEVAQLTAQLETVREESARQVARTKDRCETVRRSMQGQIADLERQLAQARAMARAAQKDRDELRIKMQAQINNLNENFEEAQLRIRSLQGHVNFLKTSYTNVFGGDNAGPNDEGCDCGNYK